MKRDLELIRKLVLAVEDNPAGFAPADIQIEGFTEDQIGYHSYLVVDAGLATGADVTTLESNGPEWKILHLTAAGHDFADACRDETNWRKAMGIVKMKAGSVTIDIMKQLLTSLLKSTLGL